MRVVSECVWGGAAAAASGRQQDVSRVMWRRRQTCVLNRGTAYGCSRDLNRGCSCGPPASLIATSGPSAAGSASPPAPSSLPPAASSASSSSASSSSLLTSAANGFAGASAPPPAPPPAAAPPASSGSGAEASSPQPGRAPATQLCSPHRRGTHRCGNPLPQRCVDCGRPASYSMQIWTVL